MSRQPDKPTATATDLGHYWRVTRGPWYGFVFALPVLLAYEGLVWVLQPHLINGADAVLKSVTAPLLRALGPQREVVLPVVLAVSGIGCFVAHRRRYRGRDDGRLRLDYFALMFSESCIYALFFGQVVNRILATMLGGSLGLQLGGGALGPLQSFTLALGAGLYEELLFRVLLMGGLSLALIHLARVPMAAAWGVAALVSSVVFSSAHYLGSAADQFTPESFLFRFVAGGLLAALYGLRGFGVAVWTHALYDVLVMVIGT
jgi:membrane protease YdiL (CAAX protease family)